MQMRPMGWHSGYGALSSPGPSSGAERGRGFCPLLPVLVVGGTGVTLKAPDPTSCPRAGGKEKKASKSFVGPKPMRPAPKHGDETEVGLLAATGTWVVVNRGGLAPEGCSLSESP